MYMRDLACCAGKMVSCSTAPDLVRVGLASNVSINGLLAGAIAALSSLCCRTSRTRTHLRLGLKIGDAFAKQAR